MSDGMKFAIGIDGGGTKTAFVLGTEEKILVHLTKSGCSYLEIGAEGVVSLIKEGVTECMQKANVSKCEVCCIGLPCYGENKKMDEFLEQRIKEELFPMKVTIVNDAVVGWAGSLECREGIHLVAGTGSLAIGKGKDASFARSGGWNEFFSDEGSCYWVGKEGMNLFSKQADGRVEKGALYQLVKERYHLYDDFEFIDIVLKEFAPYRDQVASFQRIVLEAAQIGDVSAQHLYTRAAEELVQMVLSVKHQLNWSKENVDVSIYGGLTHAGEFLINPLKVLLKEQNCVLHAPKRSAVEGAFLIALQNI